MIVTDKHEKPAVVMASSLPEKKQPELLLDVLIQMKGGPEELAKLARRLIDTGDDEGEEAAWEK